MPETLATPEAEIGRIKVHSLPRQKVQEPTSQPIKSWAWWYTPVIPATWET
jgi:hypothetical protein